MKDLNAIIVTFPEDDGCAKVHNDDDRTILGAWQAKNPFGKKPEDSDDPERLQMMDENNARWVDEWKRTVKPKTK